MRRAAEMANPTKTHRLIRDEETELLVTQIGTEKADTKERVEFRCRQGKRCPLTRSYSRPVDRTCSRTSLLRQYHEVSLLLDLP